MSSRRANEIAQEFQRRLLALNETRKRIEKAYRSRQLRVVDVEASYSSLFLQVVMNYEAAMEQFCLGLVVKPGGVESSQAGVAARVTVRSYAHAMELATGPRGKFPSWLGKNDLVDVAKLLLRNGAPFTATESASWAIVQQCVYIRNAIAHPSDHAYAQFKRHVIQSTPLPPRERKVPAFLRSQLTAAGETRWENYAASLSGFVASTVV